MTEHPPVMHIVNAKPSTMPHRGHPGFALVVTISLLILLTIIAVGLLSLSAVSLRSTGQGAAQAQAQANARLAMMLAIGELQKQLGPDRAITAPSAIYDQKPDTEEPDGLDHRHLTGVWQARFETLAQTPDYSRESSFRRWLVSNTDEKALESSDFARQGSLSDPVVIVGGSDGTSTSGTNKDQAQAGRVPLDGGALAWWVGDENRKAFVNPRDKADRAGSQRVADLIASAATPGAHGIRALDDFAEFPTNTTTSDKLLTISTLPLVKGGASKEPMFHHLSPHSQSVLANVTTGSLRKDLSLYLERTNINWLEGWGRQEGKSSFPAGPLGPNNQIALSDPREYDVMPWKYLHHWYSMHRQQVGNGANMPIEAMKNYTPSIDPIRNPAWNSGVTRATPILARLQLILSYGLKPTGNASGTGPRNYDLYMYSFPVATVWNPFSVGMNVEEWSTFLHTLPLEHTIFRNNVRHNVSAGGSTDGKYKWGWPHGNMTIRVGGSTGPGLTMAPGEAQTLTYNSSQSGAFHAHDMVSRVIPWNIDRPGQQRHLGTISGVGSDRISIATDLAKWDTSGTSYGGQNFQTTFDFRCESRAIHAGHPARFVNQMFCSQVGWRHEPENPRCSSISERNFPSRTFAELTNAPMPFLHLDIRLKTLDEVQLPNKTWLHNIPHLPYAAATSTTKHSRSGVDAATTFFAHPYTMSFEQVNGIEGLIQNRPYIGASNRPGGQSRIAANSIPLAPLTSLAQLQNLPLIPTEALNWSGYYLQNQAVGNSYASPGLPPQSIKERSFPFYVGQYYAWQGGDIAGQLYDGRDWFNGADYTIPSSPASIIDRSYVANHLLFDEYFFSSMAGQSGPVFKSHGSERGVRQVVDEFLKGVKDLPIAAYRPYLPPGSTTATVLADLAPSRTGVTDNSHMKSAARLLVDGGFNINSTSVPAWTAMLAAAHLKRPVTLTGGTLRQQPQGRFIVNRHSAPLAGAADNAAGANSETNRWLGYRELSAEEIRELAAAIVQQVKKRGPFRSLGEFVNRRRSTDEEMALYGALQAALEDPKVTINKNYKGGYNEITNTDLGASKYRFPAAARGSRYQGTPAYISQADILTPIAPIIQARSDTFVVRGYGEARAADGRTIIARARCEAIVQRIPDYIDSTDLPEIAQANLKSAVNRSFGRRMIIKSFRWLADSNEI
jgi:hypothetical protein